MNMLTILAALLPQATRILFVGNSLLNFNDVPTTVARMLESDGNQPRVMYKTYFVGHLEDIPYQGEIQDQAASGNYDYVVLQGAMVSSSMTITYDQSRGIALAKTAKAHGARVLLYVEWPRRGIDETEYTMNVYRGIAKAANVEIVPVCYAWNAVLARPQRVNLYQPDGNHALPTGSFIAACSVFVRIAGIDRTPTYRPDGIDAWFAKVALQASRSVDARR